MEKIHKPQIAWKMIIAVMAISLLAIIIQWMFVLHINNNITNFGSVARYSQISGEFTSNGGVIQNTIEYGYSISEFIRNVIVGIALMGLLYFLDYFLPIY